MITGDTLYHNIKAHLSYRVAGEQWKNALSIIDFTIGKEESIWFWLPYCVFEDIDGDGVLDPIIVYGTDEGIEGRDSRMKIGMFYKGRKIFIRHQNSVDITKHGTQVDKAFHKLPESIQDKVKAIMRRLDEEGWVRFSSEWMTMIKQKDEKATVS